MFITTKRKKRKVLPEPRGSIGRRWSAVSVALSQTPAYAARPWIRVDASPAVSVYVPAYAGTKYCCVTEDHGCEQLAQCRYAATLGRGSNSRPLDRKSDVLPLCHDVTQWWLELLEIMDLSGSESSNSLNELASNLSWMITLGISRVILASGVNTQNRRWRGVGSAMLPYFCRISSLFPPFPCLSLPQLECLWKRGKLPPVSPGGDRPPSAFSEKKSLLILPIRYDTIRDAILTCARKPT